MSVQAGNLAPDFRMPKVPGHVADVHAAAPGL